ncbi:putative lipid II flippase FtsW [Pontibacillus litoralis]|uniref:Probable peptidoglycan glycosyltransferase FtsW n=1 Tax=Pontibacillus litoralis JSM 072002 TaxID=1385512 RepID=A0A0A5G986_9BACI|nr:putative lipid II flippase FtsW [Pontibacillus litoralis]KGX88584.1 cell division protein FtsW [Pontibacillus litoralis JSM 072002]
MKKFFKDYDFTLIFIPLMLTAFGVMMIYSASMVSAVVLYDVPSNYFMLRQAMWFGLGIVAFVLTMLFPYQKYQKLVPLMILFTIISLVLVKLMGNATGNASSWFEVGPIKIQPSEPAKVFLIIYLASVLSKKQAYIDRFWQAVLPPLVITITILALIAVQPDIGTAGIIFAIACTVILSSGIRTKHIVLLAIIGIVFLAFAIPNMTSVERVSRFTGAYAPFEDPEDGGFHLIQSYLAIGTGGITGVGLGQGVQKLGYLPEPHTDFIMSVIAEELGFIGVLFVLASLTIIVLRGLYVARKCKDAFGSLLAIGISSMVGIQALINLGAISGLLPITGVPLPFISYGGSSLLVLLASIGILNNIAKQAKLQEDYTYIKQTSKNAYSDIHAGNATQSKGGRSWVQSRKSIKS